MRTRIFSGPQAYLNEITNGAQYVLRMLSLIRNIPRKMYRFTQAPPANTGRVPINALELQTKASLIYERLNMKNTLLKKLDQNNNELKLQGQEEKIVKYTRDNVLRIEEIQGNIVFLERGNAKAGYKHILEHISQFKDCKISVAEIPMLLFNTLKKNSQLGYQGKGQGRPVYQSDKVPLAITVGSNGYIVGANPNPNMAA